MPIQMNVDAAGGFVASRVHGAVRDEDVQTLQTVFESEVGSVELEAELLDVSDADFESVETQTVAAVARRNLAFLKSLTARKTKVAIFCPMDLQFGLGRVFKAWSSDDDSVADVRVFRDRREAEAWLAAS